MATAQMSANFYATSCPNLTSIVRGVVKQAIINETRMAASLLRMHFNLDKTLEKYETAESFFSMFAFQGCDDVHGGKDSRPE